MKKQPLHSSRLLASILREAKFLNWPLIVVFQESRISAEIIDVEDSSPRSEGEGRFFSIRLSSAGTLGCGESVGIEVFGPSRVLLFASTCSPVLQTDFDYRLSVPSEAELVSRRNSERQGFEGQLRGEGIIVSGGKSTRIRIELFDRSLNGVGLIIGISTDLIPRIGDRVSGVVFKAPTKVNVLGNIVRVQLPGGDGYGVRKSINFFRVGLELDMDSHIVEMAPVERRKNSRYRSSIGNVCVRGGSPRSWSAWAEVIDCASLGLSVRPLNQSDVDLFCIGLVVKLDDIDGSFEVCGINETLVSLRLAVSNLEDALPWLRRITGDLSLGDAEIDADRGRILNLFIRSGAVSDEYLAAQTGFDDLVLDKDGGSWGAGAFHRWVQRDQEGEVLGHVTCFRYSTQVWQFSDLAGSRFQKDEGIGKKFVKNFFRSIAEVGKTSIPVPRFQMIFNEGHPYWKGLVDHLRSYSQQTAISYLNNVKYFRFSNSEIGSEELIKAKEGIRKIGPEDVQIVKEANEYLVEGGIGGLAVDLDFEVKVFGSRVLSDQIIDFRRDYFSVDCVGAVGTLILSHFPPGLSVNQNPCVAWFLSKAVSENDFEKFSRVLGVFASENGFHSPGIILAEPGMPGSKGATKSLIVTSFAPDVLLHYWEREDVHE